MYLWDMVIAMGTYKYDGYTSVVQNMAFCTDIDDEQDE